MARNCEACERTLDTLNINANSRLVGYRMRPLCGECARKWDNGARWEDLTNTLH